VVGAAREVYEIGSLALASPPGPVEPGGSDNAQVDRVRDFIGRPPRVFVS
jgi:hypothetical protein